MYEQTFPTISTKDDSCNAYIIKPVNGQYSFEDFLLNSYDYDLPEERIAQIPAQPAESAKLLIRSKSDASIQDYHFFDLPNFIKKIMLY